MAITPVEMIIMAPKSQEASLQKTIETHKPVHEQIQIHDNVQTQTQRSQEKIVPMKESENKEYRYDAKEKGNSEYKYTQKKKDKKQKDTAQKKSHESNGFDVRI